MKTFWKANKLANPEVFPLKKLFLVSLSLNLGVGVLAFIIQRLIPPQIPLFYGMAEAEKVVAPSWTLIIPTLTSLGILTVNFLLGFMVEEEFLKKTLVLSGIAASFFAVITTLKIAFLVGSF